ncbi:serine protease inhibitor 2.1-like [Zootoca vivipara]|uniref:serine protease inhibitor 2.1-like n=1 Tax=Zootoca vivipara TaxID=8524 RepID=UPI00293BCA96|nr:serine protease inhibitor 2.1-like [Zootoca vivipara]XP_060138862.1 serine protease inhibitor 2.1-like [Zootoca vivipara]
MKPAIQFSLLLIVLQVHNGHGDKDPLQEKLASSIADFAFKFSRQVASLQSGQNIFFSPLSISMAFSMIGMGAKSNTQNQIYKGLGLTSIDTSKIHKEFKQLIQMLKSPGAKMDIGNALWIKKPHQILPKFSKGVKSLYKAESFNFEQPSVAEKQINDYVNKKTHGKITKAVQDLDPAAIMVLVNYIYFKDDWEYPFDPELTHKEDFFIDEGKTVKVDMMRNTAVYRYFHDKALSCWVVELPHKGGAVAWFILPDKGKLKEVEDAMGEETLSKWRKSLTEDKISLFLPKFSMSASYDLNNVLSGLGITDVFSSNADLSGITGSSGLKINKAIHQAVLDIHEKGSEAAAVTVVTTGFKSLSLRDPVVLKFTRPFFLTILAPNDGPLLFMGKVMNPVQK